MILKYKDKDISKTYQAGDGITLKGNSFSVTLPSKALSKEEYDALSEEEKQSDTLYLVDEPSCFVPMSIQEYDTEDGWHVRKWSSGYVEMSKSFSFYKGAEAYGPVPGSPFTLPVVLKEKHSEQTGFLWIESTMANYVSLKSVGLSSTPTNELTQTAIIVFESSGSNQGTIKGSVMVTGRWK